MLITLHGPDDDDDEPLDGCAAPTPKKHTPHRDRLAALAAGAAAGIEAAAAWTDGPVSSCCGSEQVAASDGRCSPNSGSDGDDARDRTVGLHRPGRRNNVDLLVDDPDGVSPANTNPGDDNSGDDRPDDRIMDNCIPAFLDDIPDNSLDDCVPGVDISDEDIMDGNLATDSGAASAATPSGPLELLNGANLFAESAPRSTDVHESSFWPFEPAIPVGAPARESVQSDTDDDDEWYTIPVPGQSSRKSRQNAPPIEYTHETAPDVLTLDDVSQDNAGLHDRISSQDRASQIERTSSPVCGTQGIKTKVYSLRQTGWGGDQSASSRAQWTAPAFGKTVPPATTRPFTGQRRKPLGSSGKRERRERWRPADHSEQLSLSSNALGSCVSNHPRVSPAADQTSITQRMLTQSPASVKAPSGWSTPSAQPSLSAPRASGWSSPPAVSPTVPTWPDAIAENPENVLNLLGEAETDLDCSPEPIKYDFAPIEPKPIVPASRKMPTSDDLWDIPDSFVHQAILPVNNN